MSSAHYQRFVQSLDAATSPRALTYDIAAFSQLEGLERSHGAHLLLEQARRGDVRAISTLAYIPWPEAIPDLEALRASASPATRAAAHRALARLRNAPEDVAHVADDALSDSPLSIDAAYELSQRDDPEAVAALLAALAADEPIVRMHAMEGLLRTLDLEDLKCDHSPLDAIAARLFNTLDCVRLPATHAMRHVLEAVIDGATPDALDLRYVPTPDPAPLNRFLHATDHAPDAILALGPHDRAWAEAVLLGEISRRDLLAPQAAVLIRLQDAPQALREVLQRDAAASHAPDAFTAAADAALRAFGSDTPGGDPSDGDPSDGDTSDRDPASAIAPTAAADPDPSAP
jgi:hypothetical protein